MKANWRAKPLAAFSFFLLLGCGTPREESPRTETKPQVREARVEVRGGRIHLADSDGRRLWEAQADSIEGDFLSGEGRMYKVKCTLLEADKPAVTAEAGEAAYRPDGQEVMLRGDVKAEWPDEGVNIHANQVTFNLEKRTIEARGDVRLSHREEHLQGSLLRTDVALGSVELTNSGEER